MPQLLVATIVMKDTANVLLGKAAGGPDAGLWVIPGGYLAEGEQVVKASERITKEETGLSVIPKQVLFLSEVVEPDDHRIAVFCFAECGSSGDPKPGPGLTEVRFVDPRTLGEYQKEGMSPLTADAFFKFSKILQMQMQAQAGTKVPAEGTVN